MTVCYETISGETVLDVPADVRLCPYCGAKLTVAFSWWSQQDDGSWAAESAEIACSQEPDIDDDAWEDHWDAHCDMPYVYWMPAEHEVLKWVNSKYRFEVKS